MANVNFTNVQLNIWSVFVVKLKSEGNHQCPKDFTKSTKIEIGIFNIERTFQGHQWKEITAQYVRKKALYVRLFLFHLILNYFVRHSIHRLGLFNYHNLDQVIDVAHIWCINCYGIKRLFSGSVIIGMKNGLTAANLDFLFLMFFY